MNRPHFRRHPRIAPDSARGKRPDRADGLPLRASGGVITAGGTAIIGADDRIYPFDALPGRTRYDLEWPDVIAAEAPGGDLAAMAAPLPGMDYRHLSAAELADAAAWAAAWLDEHRLNILPADQSGFTALADWPVWDYGEGYDIEPEATLLASALDTVAEMDTVRQYVQDRLMVRAAATAYDLGLRPPLRSDPPIYRDCLAGHGQVTR